MKYSYVLKRAWQLVWRMRAMWLFGALLALTTVNGIYWGYPTGREEWDWDRSRIRVTEDTTIYLPGEGLIIDFTAPGAVSIRAGDENLGELWEELREELREEFTIEFPDEVWAVVIAVGVVLAGIVLVSLLARYVSEAALIRMVDAAEETGERLGLRRGLRFGFSRTAWRLFLIDLLLFVVRALVLLVLLALALSPLLLWFTRSTPARVAGTVAAVGLFFLWFLGTLAVGAVLSLLVQVMRRACAVDGLGVRASIRRGLATVKGNLKQTLVVWLVWMGVRLAWMLAAVPAMVAILPVTLAFILAGALIGGVPSAVVGGLLTPFLEGPFPWIVGGVVGLPLFILVMITPMLFLGGLVEVYKSGVWTLTYRELRAAEAPEPSAASEGVSASLPATSTA
jgi:hypothetical protein